MVTTFDQRFREDQERKRAEADIEELNRVTIHELLRDDMERGMNTMRSILDHAMFVDHLSEGRAPTPPPTWRDRLSRKFMPITGYCSTLWQALRGVDLVERQDWDQD